MLVEMERQSGFVLTLETASASTRKTRRKRKPDEPHEVAGSSAAAADGETESSRERLLAKLSNKCALLEHSYCLLSSEFYLFLLYRSRIARVGRALDDEQFNRNQGRFLHQFNYSLTS